MNEEEIKSLIEQLKAIGLDEDKIMDLFYTAFTEGKMDRKDLETLSEAMGYELTDDFKNDPQPDPIDAGASEGEGISEEKAEEAKEIKPGESAEEFKDKLGIDDADNSDNDDTDDSESDNSDDTDDDKEWDEAQKMFKI